MQWLGDGARRYWFPLTRIFLPSAFLLIKIIESRDWFPINSRIIGPAQKPSPSFWSVRGGAMTLWQQTIKINEYPQQEFAAATQRKTHQWTSDAGIIKAKLLAISTPLAEPIAKTCHTWIPWHNSSAALKIDIHKQPVLQNYLVFYSLLIATSAGICLQTRVHRFIFKGVVF